MGNALFFYFLPFFSLGFAILLGNGFNKERTERKLKRIEFYLDLMIDHLELDRFPEELKEIARDPDPQQRLNAVRLYRKKTGATLKEAIEAVKQFSGNNFR